MIYRTMGQTEDAKARCASGFVLALFILCSSTGATRYFEDEFSGGPLASQNEHILFGDDFESGCWQANNPSGDTSGSCEEGVMWMRSQMQGPYSGIVVTAPHPVRKGKHAIRFEWRPENYRSSNATKKAMLHAPKVRKSRNVERRYAFSVFFTPGWHGLGFIPDALLSTARLARS